MHPSHLVVGLGNPETSYALNRHNIGFMAADVLAASARAPAWQRKFKGQVTTVTLGGKTFLLLKPMTFMNLSGEAVGEAMRFYKLAPADVIVFHDDIDLLPGKVKVKQGGRNGGHNGLKSVDAHIGPDYWRVRMGIGRPANRNQVTDYVLSDFAKADRAWLEELLHAVAEHFPLMLAGKDATFMSRVAESLKTPEERP
jgi:PTH1 family peptidyl-tRNA hydrolase